MNGQLCFSCADLQADLESTQEALLELRRQADMIIPLQRELSKAKREPQRVTCPSCDKHHGKPSYCEECFACLQAQIAWSDRNAMRLTDELVKAKETQ